ncbi:MAG: glycerol-3-phosphate dehydrogenase [Rubrivivax sp.]
MAQTDCDVLVVGGGINGAGIARDLAGRGWRVVLVEQDDLAAHTSSASTKLVHGGLRYLEHYEFALVRKALQEREVLLRAAPHLIRPLRFVMPHDAAMRPAWVIRTGLFLYDHLARREVLPGSGAVDLRSGPLGAPLQPRFTQGFVYSDGWVDDARLVVANAVDARERGATVHTRTRCELAERGPRHWTATLRHAARPAGRVTARLLVNAAGPWAEAFLRQVARPAAGEVLAGRSLRLVKGSHIVVPRLFEHDHAYILQNPDQRIIFAIPYEERYTLVGTTDVDYRGDPAAAAIDDAEVDYLCEQASRYFRRPVGAADVRWSYSGVRPLLDDGADAAAVTRDYQLESRTDGAPLLSVWGGKLTTYRKLAEEAAAEVGRLLGEQRPPWTEQVPLPGGDLREWIGEPTRRPDQDFERFVHVLAERAPGLAPALLRRLARAYGGRVGRVLARGLGDEVAPGLHEGELRHLCEEEWAQSADDVLWRRSKLGLHLDAAARARVAVWLGEGSAVAAAEAPCS